MERPEFLQEMEKTRSPTTVRLLHDWVEKFHAFLVVREVTRPGPEDLTAFQQELTWKPNKKGKPYSEHTVNQAIWAVRTYLRWAVERGYLPSDPSAHLKTRRPPSKKRKLTTAEKTRMLAMPDLSTPIGLRNRALLGVLLELKSSRAWCASLNVQDLCLATETMVERGKKLKLHELSSGLLDDLRAYLEYGRGKLAGPEESALFVTRTGSRMKPVTVGRVFLGALKLAGAN